MKRSIENLSTRFFQYNTCRRSITTRQPAYVWKFYVKIEPKGVDEIGVKSRRFLLRDSDLVCRRHFENSFDGVVQPD